MDSIGEIKKYKKLLLQERDKLKIVQDENLKLINELSACKSELNVFKGKVEILNQFYQDYKDYVLSNSDKKDLISEEEPISNEKIDLFPEEKPTYEKLKSEYFIHRDNEIVVQLFEDYNINPVQVLNDLLMLNDLNNPLPSNIETMVKKYKITKEYEIIQKSLILIKNLKRSSYYIERGIYNLSDLYINNFRNDNKKLSLKYVRMALLIYPFQFDKFLNSIKSYLYDDINEHIEKFKVELYGKNNVLLKKPVKEKKSPEKKPIKKFIVEKNNDSDNKITYDNLPKPKGFDELLAVENTPVNLKRIEEYNHLSIPELIDSVMKLQGDYGKKRKALRVYSFLIRLKKPPEHCLLFYYEINKKLRHKLI